MTDWHAIAASIRAAMRPRKGDGYVLLALQNGDGADLLHSVYREKLARMVYCGWAGVCKAGRTWAYAITPSGRHALSIADDAAALGAWWEACLVDMVEGQS